MNQVQTIQKKDKFHIFNFVLACIMCLACAAMLVYYLVNGDPNKRVMSCVVTMIPFLLPFLIELIIKRRFGNYVVLIYLLFVFYAAFVGSVIGVFKTSSVADKIAHTLFGYLACYLGLAFSLGGTDRNEHPWFVLIICFVTSMAFASLWEIFEFSCDSLLGQTMQGYPINGITDLTDSMLDMVVNLAGAVVFVVQYVLHIVLKKDLMIDTLAKDFPLKKTTKTKEK